MNAGHLYVLTNKYMPGLVKIGYTDRTPHERASELSNVTGVPGKFVVERSWELAEAQSWERRWPMRSTASPDCYTPPG